MRDPHDTATSPQMPGVRDITRAGRTIGLAATAFMLAAAVMIAIVAPV